MVSSSNEEMDTWKPTKVRAGKTNFAPLCEMARLIEIEENISSTRGAQAAVQTEENSLRVGGGIKSGIFKAPVDLKVVVGRKDRSAARRRAVQVGVEGDGSRHQAGGAGDVTGILAPGKGREELAGGGHGGIRPRPA